MVLAPILLIAGLGVVVFIFKDQIASFVSGGLTDVGKNVDQFGKDVQTNIGQIGKDIDTFGKEQQQNFDQFVKDTQLGIDASLAGTQENINKFFTDAQKNFDANITGISIGINEQKKAIDQFGIDAQKNIVKSVSGIQQGFTDFSEGVAQFVANPFGGQKNPKEITKEVNAMTLNKPTGQSVSRSARGQQTTTKPDILLMPNRPITLEAIKPAVKTVTKPTVSKFLTGFPSDPRLSADPDKVPANFFRGIPIASKRSTRFS